MSEHERTQEEEMGLTFKQNRQPRCVYRNSSLDRILQAQSEPMAGEWDRKLRQYVKCVTCVDPDKSYRQACGARTQNLDWHKCKGSGPYKATYSRKNKYTKHH